MENLLQVVTSLAPHMDKDEALGKYEEVHGMIGKLINLEKEKIRTLEALRATIADRIMRIRKGK